ncbi:MAG: hypothetical protein IPL98_08255 [Saprospiraceae bacterium]|nr:hypothetical protein [Saprospiraceae bacterium]
MNILPNGTYTFTEYGIYWHCYIYIQGMYQVYECRDASITISSTSYNQVRKLVIIPDDEVLTPLGNTSITSIYCVTVITRNAIGTRCYYQVQQYQVGSTVVLNPNGTVSYTPPTGFVGTVTIPYSICDNGIPKRDTAKLMIGIGYTNRHENQTYANDDALTSPVNTKLNGIVSLNDGGHKVMQQCTRSRESLNGEH